MQISSRTKYMALALGALAVFSQTDSAHAQTQPMTATAIVDNTLSITEVTPLNFGDALLISNATHDATVSVATDGTMSVGVSGVTATAGIVDDSAATQASLTVEDGAPGGTINITVDNVVSPALSGDTLTVSAWQASYNSAGDVALTPGTSAPFTFNAGFDSGTNTLELGATATASGSLYGDGIYLGGNFDVIFSY